ncbi:MAG: SpoIIE family protein phosphatase [Chlamydiales bacterium]|nr:SpoIIE family protein phosphatase [Chlamydiales bacterium]
MKKNNINKHKVLVPVKIGGSLTRRVALICCIFLVVPLLFYSIFIYQQIYHEELKNIYNDLDRSESEQSSILSSFTDYQLEALNFLYEIIIAKKNNQIKFTQQNLIDTLQQFSTQEHVLATAYIGFNGCDTDICNGVSNPYITVNQIIESVPLEDIKQTKKMQVVQFVPGLGNVLLLLQAFTNAKDSSIIDALLISIIDINVLLHRLKMIQTRYEENLSILDENGNVLATTSTAYVSKIISPNPSAVIQLYPLSNQQSGYYFSINNQKRFGDIAEYKPAKLYLFADVSEEVLFGIWYQYLKKFLILLLTILVIGGGATAIVASRISMPLRRLIQTMIKVAHGNLQERYVQDKMGFEINQVGEQFNMMIESLLDNMEKVETEKIKQETYRKELAIGQQAQRSLFPSTLPKLAGYDVDAGFIAALEVGGDFYDLYMKNEEELFFCIADTAGKGIYACIYSLLVRSMLRSFFESENTLEKIVKKTNELFLKDTGYTGVFVTSWVGILNVKTNKLVYTCCGHLPAILLNEKKEIGHLHTNGIALGVSEFEPEIRELVLNKKDALILYTDGIIEAHSITNELFGEKRLEHIVRNKQWKTSKELILEIETQIREFSGAKAQFDDITLLVIRSLKE